VRTLRFPFLVTLLVAGWALPVQALTAEVSTRSPSLMGSAFTFRAVVADAVGAAEYRWNLGDGTRTDFEVGRSEIEHTYSQPGHYAIQVTVRDQAGFTSVAFFHTVHFPLTPRKPSGSAPIVYDEARKRVYNVNQDNDSISAIDPEALVKVGELPVYQRPEALALAPDGKLWVMHRDDYAVAIVDPERFVIERGFRLPYASQPMGLAMSPMGDAAYVTLMATGKLLKLSAVTGEILGELDVGFRPRGVSVSHDGKDVYVTRFISADTHGEITQVDGPTLKIVRRIELAADTTTLDTDQQGRGLPNFVFSIGISPDGRQGWAPAKKDDVFRGTFRDAQPLTQDNIVRPMAAIIDLLQGAEELGKRIDFDDRNLPSHVEFSPLGDYAFVTFTGINRVEVRDAYTRALVTALQDAGLGPRASVLGPRNRMFVQGSLTRNVVVYDVATILDSSDPRSIKLTDIRTVDQEKLAPDVLRGKQVFYDSEDKRMSVQGYISCASCHFEGFEDGRVWDLTDQGEGLRNTTSLLGRRGMGQGRVHWSGNFDEIQDFENPIRALFNGLGFLADDVFAKVSDPLGAPKKGLNSDLDALAAFVTTLDHVNPSPYRNADGTMTAEAEAGKALFGQLGCNVCHVGADFTDSARDMLHDVGTIKPSSGSRAHAPLLGIDTPTLLGVWETPPYLHDGSAATLRDVLTTANPRDEHGFVSSLTPDRVNELVAYLLQVDNELPPRRLPFESTGPVDGAANAAGPLQPAAGGCACATRESRKPPKLGGLFGLAALILLWCGRRAGTPRSYRP